MDKQEKESLKNKFFKVVDSIEKGSKKIKDAFEENMGDSSALLCVKDGLLDFDLIEKDVQQIHENLEIEGDRIIGSHLILDDENDFMQIKTYSERDGETFVNEVKVNVKKIDNIPENVFKELKQNGRVELNLKI
jgi:hypothetical protein